MNNNSCNFEILNFMEDDSFLFKNKEKEETSDVYMKDLLNEIEFNLSSNLITENLLNVNITQTDSSINEIKKRTVREFSDFNRNFIMDIIPAQSSFNNLKKILNNSFSFLVPVQINNELDKENSKFSKGSRENSEINTNLSASSKNKLVKSFPCSFFGCNKIYKSKENLILHFKNIHLKQKPYSCRFCKSLFSHRNGKNIIFLLIFIFFIR